MLDPLFRDFPGFVDCPIHLTSSSFPFSTKGAFKLRCCKARR